MVMCNRWLGRTRDRYCYNGEFLIRWMTSSRRVQDRSKKKRVHDLEVVTEKWKIVSKIIYLMELLKQEPEMVIPVRSLENHRRQINLPRPHRISDFLRKTPKLFELYKDQKGVLWCGMTPKAEDLMEQQQRVIEDHADKAAEYVTRFLMMSVEKRLPLEKIAHFRRDFGLSLDFRVHWVHKYPQHFKVVKTLDGIEFLELVSWNPEWAITELEKKAVRGAAGSGSESEFPGMLSLPFPLKFPSNYKRVYRYYAEKIQHFQEMSYLSPYADARGLKAGSLEFDKRAVAVMHELLNFTIEKRLVTDHLTHFRWELVMPQKLMRLLLKHCGIFYVSERGKRFSVFLTEAYEGSELIEKCPLVLWKEKVLGLVGYRGRKKKLEVSSEGSDAECFDDLVSDQCDSELRELHVKIDQTGTLDYEDPLLGDDLEMDVGEIAQTYRKFENS
ncbi:protein WHAT'S THIS FACTOR 1 homolog, chloroplastic [Vigna umbellata]|uniref:protein WHAT'S THIS FACTOR 1 homolog, chloroplastic n=1 Tax=Vigna umbellata TaxID=87088 RepID=UPI001F5F0043|nr:protein WHAT'S THIS FACTOR 1 homolog, chloroplastic [Vigna umbellata]XP_047168847.1 protein WHAT'S THIS FACTOR 1 homolog, chloroplastic [Vigna umbellata]XP_047168848.1 protein WHAT'S THIS FACTOR 1 homolog, chloroplastic [Vigna umbellata]